MNIRDDKCENCAKFSHCNNNDLVCIRKFQQLKAENEELKTIIKKALDDFRIEIGTYAYDSLLKSATKHKIDISDFK